MKRTEGTDSRFVVHTRTASGIANRYGARKIVVATCYYDLPNPWDVPGEDLPHGLYCYTEAHPFWNEDIVIGEKNSAAEAALDLFRAGARLTLVHQRA